MGEKGERLYLQWIEAAKGVAILAVIIDHLSEKVFSNRMVSLWSYFSVTVFVFLAGITSYYSSERHKNDNISSEIIRKIKSILVPYAIATCFYQLAIHRSFDLVEYFKHLLKFNSTQPFYFVVFYIQLVLISPYIYILLNRWEGTKEKIMHSVVILLGCIISIFCIRYTFILDVWGGGKYLFGGSYFLVYLLGEISAHYGLPLRKEKSLLKMLMSICIVCMCILWLAKFEFKLDLWINEPFGTGINPPGVTLMVYSMCTIVCIYYIFYFMQTSNIGLFKWINSMFSHIGHCSFYIFLYHKLVLDYFLIHFDISNVWVKRVIFLGAMLGIPIIIKYVNEKWKKYWK